MAFEAKHLEHLWISEEQVSKIPNKPTAREQPRDIAHGEHGSKLSDGLKNIIESYNNTLRESSLKDENMMVFKVSLPEGEKIDNKQRQKLIEEEGLTINAVKDSRHMIVSTDHQKFQRLLQRVERYKTTGKHKGFQYVEEFEPFKGIEKQTDRLHQKIENLAKSPGQIDIQMLLLPGWSNDIYKNAITQLSRKINDLKGQLPEAPYFLTDGTPVMRVIMSSIEIERLSEDSAIYRVEETRFYTPVESSSIRSMNIELRLDESVQIDSLPVVAILDSGINFPPNLKSLIVAHWKPNGFNGGDCDHGTKVASKAIFANVGHQIPQCILTPRVKIIDCNIMDHSLTSEGALIGRIQQAVANFQDITKIFNLSVNSANPIEGDEISIFGYELDNLMSNNNIQFVISAGNHGLWRTSNNIEEIIGDDDSRISAPADSMLGITVGSIVGCEHTNSICNKNMITPYSRIGPGFAGFRKPDIVGKSATIIWDGQSVNIPEDEHSVMIGQNGWIAKDAGTSFAAPIIAGDIADIAKIVPGNDIFLAKALLFNAALPLYDEEKMSEEEASLIGNLYGRGLSEPDISKYSEPHRVTFVRSGELNRIDMDVWLIYNKVTPLSVEE
jgi:hypothetical protein